MKKMISVNKKLQKLLSFFENKSIKWLAVIYFLFSLLLVIMKSHPIFNNIYVFVVDKSGGYLVENNSNLITIATVFVGIYFTVYTLLLTITRGSTYGRLSKHNKITLIKILNAGFSTSFSYVIVSLFYIELYSTLKEFASFLMTGLLLMFMYSALVFGIVIFFVLRSDINNSIENSE